MKYHQWQEIIGTIGIFVLLTVTVVTVIWQVAISQRAKAQLAREGEYRKLVAAGTAGQERIERRLEAIERILKDVE
ncbi:hypothetical protein AB0D04_06750 [Streptomyces sp. NPDC048483]|uniref:hypothetical protein n=1 Tax=Streptomyces sp. NPDC048483 TaxID=3154927 RepID=UPI00342142FB